MRVITTRMDEKDVKDLIEIEKEERAERAEVIRRLLGKAIKEWKTQKALEKLREHKISLRKASEFAGISYIEMLDLSSKAGIDTGYSLKELERDLKR
ncbi:MAG: UPF0175 family protein [archaeon]